MEAADGGLADSSPAEQADLGPAPALLNEPLSARELEMLRLIAAGLPDREIAEKLSLSLYTVKFHVYNLFANLGVHSRTQALVCARALGLLPAD